MIHIIHRLGTEIAPTEKRQSTLSESLTSIRTMILEKYCYFIKMPGNIYSDIDC